ncbi:MAG: CorA family divalent cation transporter [Candidatus Micrarchaeia archaeon]|jgi:magnesium transporter
MVRNTLGNRLKIKTDPNSVILAVESQGFCVSLLKSGKTEKQEGNRPSEFNKLVGSSCVSWVDFVAKDLATEAEDVADSFGFGRKLVESLLTNKRGSYIDNDKEMGLMIPAVIVNGFDVRVNPLLILIKSNLVMTLHGTEVKRFFHLRRYAETFIKKIKMNEPAPDKLTRILIRILDENNGRNFDHLREIEENGDKLSEVLADPKTPREILGPKIYGMKHALIVYLGALWSTADVLNALRYGDPELLTDDEKILNQMGFLSEEINTHISLAEHLSEVLASGLEVLQSIYNNQLQILNNKLAMVVTYLTIIGTAVLVPNTIATVMSNSAFNMTPADAGWYLAFLAISTILAVILSWVWVKKMGWVPNRPDSG